MSERFWDEQINPLQELMDLLYDNGIRYNREGDGVRFAFSQHGCEWETVARSAQQTLLLYGMYPFRVTEETKVLQQMNEINAMLVNGSAFLHQGRVVLRTEADLFDLYSAREAVARALEYNAGAIFRFWQAFLKAAQ